MKSLTPEAEKKCKLNFPQYDRFLFVQEWELWQYKDWKICKTFSRENIVTEDQYETSTIDDWEYDPLNNLPESGYETKKPKTVKRKIITKEYLIGHSEDAIIESYKEEIARLNRKIEESRKEIERLKMAWNIEMNTSSRLNDAIRFRDGQIAGMQDLIKDLQKELDSKKVTYGDTIDGSPAIRKIDLDDD